MQDAHDKHLRAIETIEDAVAAVREATDMLAQFGAGRASFWMSRQQIEGASNAHEIGIGQGAAKLLVAIFAHAHQVFAGQCRQPYLNHERRGIRP